MPLPFRPPTDDPKIPSVGQPVRAAGFSLSAFIVCLCDNPQPLVLNLTNSLAMEKGEQRSSVTCPSCGRQWSVGPNTRIALDIALNLKAPIVTGTK